MLLSRFIRCFSPIAVFQLQELEEQRHREYLKKLTAENQQKKPPVLPRRLNVTLIRHAETDLNVNHRLQGWIDAPLSDTGLAQAAELGHSLRAEVYDMAYSSDLIRAIQTLAEIQKRTLGYKPSPIQDKRLRERGFGVAENTDIQIYREQVAEYARDGKEHLYTPEGGETYDKFGGRIKKFMMDLFQMIDEDEGEVEHIVVVSHGLWILTMMKYLKEKPDLFILENFDEDSIKFSPRNSAVSKFEIYPKGNDGKRVIKFLEQNNYAHLTAAPRSGYSDPDPGSMKQNLKDSQSECGCGCCASGKY